MSGLDTRISLTQPGGGEEDSSQEQGQVSALIVGLPERRNMQARATLWVKAKGSLDQIAAASQFDLKGAIATHTLCLSRPLEAEPLGSRQKFIENVERAVAVLPMRELSPKGRCSEQSVRVLGQVVRFLVFSRISLGSRFSPDDVLTE
jgi:hypothetical protein